MDSVRECPFCGKLYKAMTFKEWRVNLLQHLTSPNTHNLKATDETIELLPENDMQVHNWVRVVQIVHESESKEFVEKSLAQSDAAGAKLEYVWLPDLHDPSGNGHVYFRLKY